MIKIREGYECSFTVFAHVAENMREMDRKEILATRWSDDLLAIANECARFPGICYVVFWQETPVCVIGAWPQHPGVYNVFMFATDDFPKVAKAVTKLALRVIKKTLVKQGIHRAHCLVLAEYGAVIRWLEFLGGTQEAKLERYGRNREDFVFMTWKPENVLIEQPSA